MEIFLLSLHTACARGKRLENEDEGDEGFVKLSNSLAREIFIILTLKFL